MWFQFLLSVVLFLAGFSMLLSSLGMSADPLDKFPANPPKVKYDWVLVIISMIIIGLSTLPIYFAHHI